MEIVLLPHLLPSNILITDLQADVEPVDEEIVLTEFVRGPRGSATSEGKARRHLTEVDGPVDLRAAIIVSATSERRTFSAESSALGVT